MIEIHGINKKVSQWPRSLKHFGLNPYGDAIWRVIWSESRVYMVGGMWAGRPEYRWIPKYPGVKAWILEKWLSCTQFGGTRQSWEWSQWDSEARLYTLGPYPERGEFEQSYTFPTNPPAQIEEVIQMVNAGQNYSLNQKRLAIQAEHDKQEKAWLDRGEAIVLDSQGAFKNHATSVNPAKKTADNMDFAKRPEHLNMPKKDRAFFTN